MTNTNPEHVGEVALLTKSIEFVVRQLARILMGRIVLTRLQEIVENSFVQEAENYLRKERPGRDVPLTKLALLTGLDTRKLAKLRNSEDYRKPKHSTADFLSGLTPESCVVDMWTSDPRFSDLETGTSKILEIFGKGDSFEAIVRESIGARGITVSSVLERMKKNNLVTIQEDNRVRLISEEKAPMHEREQIGKIKAGLYSTGHLLSTVNRNLSSPNLGEQKLFQRGIWTHRLEPRARLEVEATMRDFLETTIEDAGSVLSQFEDPSDKDPHLTAGVGFYYFEIEAE